jgi:hypothetical protein
VEGSQHATVFFDEVLFGCLSQQGLEFLFVADRRATGMFDAL